MAVTPSEPQGEGGAQNPAYRLASLFITQQAHDVRLDFTRLRR
jgi:hypothetical protein